MVQRLISLSVLVLIISVISACGPTTEEIATQTSSAWTPTPLPVSTLIPTAILTPKQTSTPAHYGLDVKVVNYLRNPIPEATVEVVSPGTSEIPIKKTNDEGIASWSNLPRESVQIRLNAPGYLPSEIQVNIARGSNQIVAELERDPWGLRPEDVLEDGQTILILEDFQDDEEEFIELIGNWQIVESEDEPGNLVFQIVQQSTDTMAYAEFGPKDRDYKDFTIEYRFRYVDLNSLSRNFASFGFRENYSYSFNPYWGVIRIIEFYEDELIFRFETSKNFLNQTWYEVKIEAAGEQVAIYLDGTMLARISDIAENSARWRFSVGENANIVQYDNIVVRIPSE